MESVTVSNAALDRATAAQRETLVTEIQAVDGPQPADPYCQQIRLRQHPTSRLSVFNVRDRQSGIWAADRAQSSGSALGVNMGKSSTDDL